MLSLSGCYFLPEEEKPVEAPVLVQSEENLYATTVAKRGDLQITLEDTGSLVASEMEIVKFGTGGKIKTLYGRLGQVVKKGDLLAEIEVGEVEKEIALAEASMEKQAIALEKVKLESQAKMKENNQTLKNMKSELEVLAESIEEKKQEVEMNESLYELGDISESELNESKKVLKEKEMQLEKLEVNIENLQESINSNKQDLDIRQQEIDYKQAEINLQTSKEKLAASKIYAPADGTIVFRTDTLPGQYISLEDIIYQIAKTDDYYVEYVGDLAAEFKVDEKVTLEYNSLDYSGVVVMNPQSVPKENASIYSKTARFKFDNIAELQNPTAGRLVAIKKLLAESKDTIIVPTDVVKFVNGNPYVNVLENDIRVQKNVVVGLANNAYTEIKEGIVEGEIIIIK